MKTNVLHRKRRIKRCSKALLKAVSLLLAVTLTGCGSHRELNELTITIGMGIDKDTEKEGNVRLIAQIVKPSAIQGSSGSSSGGGGGGGGQKAFFNLESSGTNAFEAVREFTYVMGKIYQSHTQVFIIGREAAEGGIEKYLDFFIRANETRPLTNIIIARGTAEEIMNIQSEKEEVPSMAVNKLIKSQTENSHSRQATIQKYIDALMSETTSFMAPMIEIRKNLGRDVLSISGMAVFKQDKMVGELNKEQTRGCLWVRGEVKSGIINVKVDGGEAAIEIKSAKGSMMASFADGKPVIKVKINAKGAMGAQTNRKNLDTEVGLDRLAGLMKEAIEKEIRGSLQITKDLKADVYGFGELLHNYHHKDWTRMKESWDEVFTSMQVELDIKTKIVSSGAILEPVYPTKKY